MKIFRIFNNRQLFAGSVLGLSLILLGAGLLYFSFITQSLLATENNRQEQYEQDIEEVKQRIDEVRISLEGVTAEKTTLQATLEHLDGQDVQLQGYMSQTRLKISNLETQIANAQIEIEAQKAILKQILLLLYQRSGASALELMITADTFSDYLADQEYLNRLRQGISQSVLEIEILSQQLAENKQHQQEQLADLEAQEISLAAVRWEKANLLQVTLNEEWRFQQHLKELEAEQAKLEEELANYLASLLASKNSLGQVAAGDIIGKNGNTGWSTGPHLHLVIYDSAEIRQDPQVYIRDHKLLWPMAGNGGWVSQGFHPGHRALDIAATEGTPIRSLAAGEIIHRGCLYGGNYSTFGVIVNHGTFSAVYIHLQAPNNPKYAECSINRRSSYGTPSIDYSVTE